MYDFVYAIQMVKTSPYHSPYNNNAVSHGGVIQHYYKWAVIWLKWQPEILHEFEYLVFHNYFGFFWKKKKSSEIYVFRSDQLSLLMYRCLLPSSVTVKIDYEENMENAHYATNDDTLL